MLARVLLWVSSELKLSGRTNILSVRLSGSCTSKAISVRIQAFLIRRSIDSIPHFLSLEYSNHKWNEQSLTFFPEPHKPIKLRHFTQAQLSLCGKANAL